MQLMASLCLKEFSAIGMNINVDKSGCMRIGERHNVDIKPIYINDIPLKWNQEIFRYLEINFLSGKKFNFKMQSMKHKYFRALNGIFGKVGLNTAPDMKCSYSFSMRSDLIVCRRSTNLEKKKLEQFGKRV